MPRYGDFAVLKLDQEPGSEVAQAASSTSLGSSRENKRANTFVSFDFSAAIVPGWHSTVFPPYFVAGAIYSGFAMVVTLAIPLRKLISPL